MSIIQFMQAEQEQQTGMVWDYVSPSRLSLWLKCPLAFKGVYNYRPGWGCSMCEHCSTCC